MFDGGLTLSLASVSGRVAWLCFSDLKGTDRVVLGLSASASDRVELYVRGPRSVEQLNSTTVIGVGEDSAEDLDAVLRLTRAPGEKVAVGRLQFFVKKIEDQRAYVELEAVGLSVPVTLSIVSVSTVDARIGVDAPSALRVYRKEVWDEMQTANTEAAGQWSEADLASLSNKAH